MEDVQNFNPGELMNCISIVNQRIAKNYFKNASSYHHDLRDINLTYFNLLTKMLVSPIEMFKIYNSNLDFFKAQQDVWKQIFTASNNKESVPVIEPKKGDRRFLDAEWVANPFLNFLKQNYLLAEKLSEQIVDEVEIDPKIRRKLDFYIGQYMDAFSPTNFLLTNPEAMRLATETKGKSLWNGLHNLMKILRRER